MSAALPHTDEADASAATLFAVELRGVIPHEAVVVFRCDVEGVAARNARMRDLFAIHERIADAKIPEVEEYRATRAKVAKHKADADVKVARLKAEVDRLEAKRAHELADLDADDLSGRVVAVDAILTSTRAALSEAAKARDALDQIADAKRPAAKRAVEAAARARLAELRHELEVRLRDSLLALSATAGPELDEVMLAALASEALRALDHARAVEGVVNYIL